MLSNEFEEIVRLARWRQKVLWGAFTASLFVYVGVSYYSQRDTPHAVNPLPLFFHQLFPVASAVIAIGSLAYWRYTYSDSYIEKGMSRQSGSDALVATIEKVDPQLRSRLEALTPFDRRRYGLALSFDKSLIVNLALNESIAILGLILAFGDRNGSEIIPFVTAAFLLNLCIFPRLDTVLKRSERWQYLSSTVS